MFRVHKEAQALQLVRVIRLQEATARQDPQIRLQAETEGQQSDPQIRRQAVLVPEDIHRDRIGQAADHQEVHNQDRQEDLPADVNQKTLIFHDKRFFMYKNLMDVY